MNIFEQKKIEWPKRIISGVQPTGTLHFGNYFGAIQRWIQLQNDGEDVSYFIADLHSMTLPFVSLKMYVSFWCDFNNNSIDFNSQVANELTENIFEMTASLLACGIDPKKSTLFLQSAVPQHNELCWIFSCLTTMPRLTNLPQFKEKSATVKNVPTGLFMYPVLQAADILIHK